MQKENHVCLSFYLSSGIICKSRISKEKDKCDNYSYYDKCLKENFDFITVDRGNSLYSVGI